MKRNSYPRRRGVSLPVLLAGVVVCAALLLAPTLIGAGGNQAVSATPSQSAATEPVMATPPAGAVSAAPTAPPAEEETAQPTESPAPSAAPAESADAYDYSQSAAESPAVDMSYFSDALFIGDSRTEGLQLYSGIQGATFYCYKGISIFDVMKDDPKKLIDINGTSYSIVDALEVQSGQFSKVYLSLGINELGYYDDQGFHDKFAALIDRVRETQPGAVIYLQTLVPVNPELCAENWPSYVNNDKVAVYNEIFKQLAEEKEVVLLDVGAALSTADGILAKENTVDGVHFTRAWYQEWLAYLQTHTVEF